MPLKTIAIICPSRGRPERLRAMLDGAFKSAARPERVSAQILVDRDDPKLPDYLWHAPQGVSFFVEERTGLSAPALYDIVAREHATGELLVVASDDVAFRTAGWDLALDSLAASYPDGLFVAYFGGGGANGVRDKVEHFATTRDWVRTVGYLMRRDYEHFSADEHVGDIAQRAGRLVARLDIVLEHLHAKYGKAERDETYAAKRREDLSGRDQQRFRDFAEERQEAAERVEAEIALHREEAA